MPLISVKGRVLNVCIGQGSGLIAATATTKVAII